MAIDLTNNLIYMIIALALLGFLWGIVRILFNSSNADVKTEGRKYMLYGILTLFVMTSVWSLVYLLRGFIIGSDQLPGISDPASNSAPANNIQGDSFRDVDQLFENNMDQRMI